MSENNVKKLWNRLLNTPEWQAEKKAQEELRRKQILESARLKKIASLKDTITASTEKVVQLTGSLRQLKRSLSLLQEERTGLLRKASESPAGRTKAAEVKFSTLTSLIRVYEQNIERLETAITMFEVVKLKSCTLRDLVDCLGASAEEIDSIIAEVEGFELELTRLSESLTTLDKTIGVVDEDAAKLFRDHCRNADAADAGVGIATDNPILDSADGGN